MSILVTILLVAAAGGTQPETVAPALPGWLAGGWAMEGPEGRWSEEWWTPPRGGVMLGAGRSGKGDKIAWWEHTRIDHADGKLRFCALPKGQAGACFTATKVTADEVVFENAGHDFPTRVAYRLEGAELAAEISGRGGAQPQRWRFRRKN